MENFTNVNTTNLLGLQAPPSYYYTYDFVSPESLFAEIKEEMKSYFSTGVLDDTMFPIYTEKALRKLGRATYKIDAAVLKLENCMAVLPPDFSYIREVWACANITYEVPMADATYFQETCVVSPYGDYDRCNPCSCPQDCNTDFKVYLKTTGSLLMQFKLSHLLKPGNQQAFKFCSHDCKNINSNSLDTYDIRDGKIITNFQEGSLYLVYYKKEMDDNQYQMIPDNFNIQEYVKAFIKWKMFEQLYNEVTDETFQQIERKYQNYKQEYYDWHVIADAEVKKQTIYQKINSIKKQRREYYKYIIK